MMLAAGLPLFAAEVAKPAPALTAFDANGHEVLLTAYRGKVVYLDFWASWCGPCRKSFPFMNGLSERYGKDGLVVLAVNVDAKRDDANQFLKAVPARFTILFDEKGISPQAFGVQGMPSSFLIDRDGVVRLVHAGFRDSSVAELDAAVAAVLKQAPK